MTDRQYERLAKIVSNGTTVAQLKEIIKINKFEVISTNPNGYTPMKSDLIDAVMGLITGYNPFTRSFVYHAHFLSNLVAFPATVQNKLIEEVA